MKTWKDAYSTLINLPLRRLPQLAAGRQRAGHTIDMRDTQIAGIVIARRAQLSTRNVRHFSDLDVDVINPWDA
ncbi:MAG: hypothetical protein WDM77_08810 [Steroidobacteraceae bacterium]